MDLPAVRVKSWTRHWLGRGVSRRSWCRRRALWSPRGWTVSGSSRRPTSSASCRWMVWHASCSGSCSRGIADGRSCHPTPTVQSYIQRVKVGWNVVELRSWIQKKLFEIVRQLPMLPILVGGLLCRENQSQHSMFVVVIIIIIIYIYIQLYSPHNMVAQANIRQMK